MNDPIKRLLIGSCLLLVPAGLFAEPFVLPDWALQMGVDRNSVPETPAFQSETQKKPFVPYSMDQMQAACERVVSKVSRVGCSVDDTPAWSDYINHGHFVPKACDPIGSEEQTDFVALAKKDLNTRRAMALPVAEVTETGKFILWGDICNFYGVDENACAGMIIVAATHEARHFAQWQAIAKEVIESAYGVKLRPSGVPMNLDELKAKYPNAVGAFMKKWTDGRHYQCREVEVYGAQIEAKEIPEEYLSSETFFDITGFYYAGCKSSKWADDFKTHLKKWDRIFKVANFTPSAAADGCG